jgi:hypothetical protein
MNLHTERISDNASEPSEGTSIIVCSNNRYYQLNERSTRPAESDNWFMPTISDNITGQKLSRLCWLSLHMRTRTQR